MAINIEKGLAVIQQFVNNCTYSMYGSRYYTDGTCDCSGSVYRAIRESGGFNYGYIPSTETLHDYLLKCGYEKIAENTDFPMQRGDVIIWGRKGYSAGANGHTGIALNNQDWIECTGWKMTTIISNHDQRWVMAGCPYFYAYRLKAGAASSTPKPNAPQNVLTAGAGYSILKDGKGNFAHLDEYGPTGTKLKVRGWHIANYNYEYIILIDRVTGKEITRQSAKGVARPDVNKAYQTWGNVGFDVTFDLKALKGHSIVVLMRATNDPKGNTAGGFQDFTETRWYHDI